MNCDMMRARLRELHDDRRDRSSITDAEWDEIDMLEDRLAALHQRPTWGSQFGAATCAELGLMP